MNIVVGIALLASLGKPPAPPSDRWFGADKVKHFLMSALVQSAAYSATRLVGGNRAAAQAMGGISAAGVGVWKEVHDKRTGKIFSVRDLVWDAAGATAAASLLNGTR